MRCSLLSIAGTSQFSSRFLGNVRFLSWMLLWAFRLRGKYTGVYTTSRRICTCICCHPAAAFKSLQLGGVIRCQRRNRLKQDVAASISFFKKRLKDRGFDMKCFDRLVARFQAKRAHGTRQRESVRKAFLKVRFNKDVSSRWLSDKIQKFMPLLKQSVPSIQVGTCWSIGCSLFRRRYAEVWNFVG